MTLPLIWLLEASKVTWHRWLPPTLTGNVALGVHVACAVVLAGGPVEATGAFALVWVSLCTIDSKRRSERLGEAFSGLSSYPVEIYALWQWKPLTDPLNALWWLLAGIGGILIWTLLRPAHWGPSRWLKWTTRSVE